MSPEPLFCDFRRLGLSFVPFAIVLWASIGILDLSRAAQVGVLTVCLWTMLAFSDRRGRFARWRAEGAARLKRRPAGGDPAEG